MQKRRNSNVLAMELHLFLIQPSIYFVLSNKILRSQRS